MFVNIFKIKHHMNEHLDRNNKLYTMCTIIQLVKDFYKLILK